MKKLSIIFAVIIFCLIPTGTAYAAEETPTSTMYNIGSVSKVFTAAAVMRLADMDLVDIDQPVVTYLPHFTMADARYAYITPRMLLNHSSGLMGGMYANAMLFGDNSTYYMDIFLQNLSQQRLMFNPGERSIYNNDGFTLAEILIEYISGVSFTEFLEIEFFELLGITDIMSPQSANFDHHRLASIYLGSNQMQPQSVGVIGSGGLLATMEDLARFSAIFMDNACGSILSRQSVDEMASMQLKMDLMPEANTLRFGLGWDAVDMFPFNSLGIQALNKGGSTAAFTTDLTVLPEFNLAVAVSASSYGSASFESLISQAIILAVLQEEGLLPQDTNVTIPELNLNPAPVSESLRAYAGIYDMGISGGMLQAEFTDYTLILTPFASQSDRPLTFLHNTDGKFVSIDGNYLFGMGGGAYNISIITFYDNYLLVQTYSDVPGLGIHAMSLPLAQRLEQNNVPDAVQALWESRSGRPFLLVSDRHTSMSYVSGHFTTLMTDLNTPGYVIRGLYPIGGAAMPNTRIIDENTAISFNTTPILNGRDAMDITVTTINGVEFISVNEIVYMDASAAGSLSQLGGRVTVTDKTIWVYVDAHLAGQRLYIDTPQHGAWFVYDNRLNCIATSLEVSLRDFVTLPDNGWLAFAGEYGAEFVLWIDSNSN